MAMGSEKAPLRRVAEWLRRKDDKILHGNLNTNNSQKPVRTRLWTKNLASLVSRSIYHLQSTKNMLISDDSWMNVNALANFQYSSFLK